MKAMTDEDFSLAGEYVLGMLDAAQEAIVAARIATDSRFTAEVEAWRLRLKPLLGPERPAPMRIWPKFEAETFAWARAPSPCAYMAQN